MRRNACLLSLLSMVASFSLLAEPISFKEITLDSGAWFKSAYPGVDLFLLAPENTPGTYHENISIITNPYDSNPIADWMPVLNSYEGSLPSAIKDYVTIAKGVIPVSGISAGFLEYSGSYSGYKLFWLQYHVVYKAVWYTISYVGDEKDFSVWKKSVNDFLTSIRFR